MPEGSGEQVSQDHTTAQPVTMYVVSGRQMESMCGTTSMPEAPRLNFFHAAPVPMYTAVKHDATSRNVQPQPSFSSTPWYSPHPSLLDTVTTSSQLPFKVKDACCHAAWSSSEPQLKLNLTTDSWPVELPHDAPPPYVRRTPWPSSTLGEAPTPVGAPPAPYERRHAVESGASSAAVAVMALVPLPQVTLPLGATCTRRPELLSVMMTVFLAV